MDTVIGWVLDEHSKRGITPPIFDYDPIKRCEQPSPSLDGIFLLGSGYIFFDNTPFNFDVPNRHVRPCAHWAVVDCEEGSLLVLFLLLTTAVSGVASSWFKPDAYL